MQEKGSVPAIRFAGFTDAWEQRKLGDVCQVTMGQSPDGSTYSEVPSDHILVQGNADLKDGWVFPRLWTTQKTKTAEAGDLIMSVRAPAGAMGKTAYNVVLGRGVAGIKGDEFIYQTLVKMDVDGYWKKFAAGSTFESINSDSVLGAEIVIPQDIVEQNAIGNFFHHLDHLITLHQRKYSRLCNIKKSMLERMFPREGATVPEIRFAGFTDAWEQRKVGDFYDFKNGLNKGKEFFGKGTPIVNFTDVFHKRGITIQMLRGRVTLSPSEISNYEVKQGDIFFTRTSETIEEIGYASVMLDSPKDTVFSGFVLRGRAIKDDPLTLKFKQFVFSTDEFRSEMIKKSSMTTRALTSGTAIKRMYFKYPVSKEEQDCIGRFLDDLDHLITLHQRELERLQNIKKSCLEKMFV